MKTSRSDCLSVLLFMLGDHSMFKHPYSHPSLQMPDIHLSALTPEERPAGINLRSNLYEMESYVLSFYAALALFDLAEINFYKNAISSSQEGETIAAVASKWKDIAARDGAMTLYHFWALMEATSNLGELPSLRGQFDARSARSAKKKFVEYFPDTVHLRNAVSHSAELTKSMEHVEINSNYGPYSDQGVSINGAHLIKGMINGRKCSYTYTGKSVSYEISKESLEKLAYIRTAWFSCFPRSPVV